MMCCCLGYTVIVIACNHSTSAEGATTFKNTAFGPANQMAPQPRVKRLPNLKARGQCGGET